MNACTHDTPARSAVTESEIEAALTAWNRYDPGEERLAMGAALTTFLNSRQKPAPAPPDTPIKQLKGGDLARLAGIWCNDPDFQKWIMAIDALSAKKKICLKCGITSRAELDHNKQAAYYFHRLIREPYRQHLLSKGAPHGSH